MENESLQSHEKTLKKILALFSCSKQQKDKVQLLHDLDEFFQDLLIETHKLKANERLLIDTQSDGLLELFDREFLSWKGELVGANKGSLVLISPENSDQIWTVLCDMLFSEERAYVSKKLKAPLTAPPGSTAHKKLLDVVRQVVRLLQKTLFLCGFTLIEQLKSFVTHLVCFLGQLKEFCSQCPFSGEYLKFLNWIFSTGKFQDLSFSQWASLFGACIGLSSSLVPISFASFQLQANENSLVELLYLVQNNCLESEAYHQPNLIFDRSQLLELCLYLSKELLRCNASSSEGFDLSSATCFLLLYFYEALVRYSSHDSSLQYKVFESVNELLWNLARACPLLSFNFLVLFVCPMEKAWNSKHTAVFIQVLTFYNLFYQICCLSIQTNLELNESVLNFILNGAFKEFFKAKNSSRLSWNYSSSPNFSYLKSLYWFFSNECAKYPFSESVYQVGLFHSLVCKYIGYSYYFAPELCFLDKAWQALQDPKESSFAKNIVLEFFLALAFSNPDVFTSYLEKHESFLLEKIYFVESELLWNFFCLVTLYVFLLFELEEEPGKPRRLFFTKEFRASSEKVDKLWTFLSHKTRVESCSQASFLLLFTLIQFKVFPSEPTIQIINAELKNYLTNYRLSFNADNFIVLQFLLLWDSFIQINHKNDVQNSDETLRITTTLCIQKWISEFFHGILYEDETKTSDNFSEEQQQVCSMESLRSFFKFSFPKKYSTSTRSSPLSNKIKSLQSINDYTHRLLLKKLPCYLKGFESFYFNIENLQNNSTLRASLQGSPSVNLFTIQFITLLNLPPSTHDDEQAHNYYVSLLKSFYSQLIEKTLEIESLERLPLFFCCHELIFEIVPLTQEKLFKNRIVLDVFQGLAQKLVDLYEYLNSRLETSNRVEGLGFGCYRLMKRILRVFIGLQRFFTNKFRSGSEPDVFTESGFKDFITDLPLYLFESLTTEVSYRKARLCNYFLTQNRMLFLQNTSLTKPFVYFKKKYFSEPQNSFKSFISFFRYFIVDMDYVQAQSLEYKELIVYVRSQLGSRAFVNFNFKEQWNTLEFLFDLYPKNINFDKDPLYNHQALILDSLVKVFFQCTFQVQIAFLNHFSSLDHRKDCITKVLSSLYQALSSEKTGYYPSPNECLLKSLCLVKLASLSKENLIEHFCSLIFTWRVFNDAQGQYLKPFKNNGLSSKYNLQNWFCYSILQGYLEALCKALHFLSLTAFNELVLPILLNSWIKEKYPLEFFPFNLFHAQEQALNRSLSSDVRKCPIFYESLEFFLTKNRLLVFPLVLYHQEPQETLYNHILEFLEGKAVSGTHDNLYLECFSFLLALALPLYFTQNVQLISKADFLLYEKLKNKISVDKFDTLFASSIDEILAFLFQFFDCSEEFSSLLSLVNNDKDSNAGRLALDPWLVFSLELLETFLEENSNDKPSFLGTSHGKLFAQQKQELNDDNRSREIVPGYKTSQRLLGYSSVSIYLAIGHISKLVGLPSPGNLLNSSNSKSIRCLLCLFKSYETKKYVFTIKKNSIYAIFNYVVLGGDISSSPLVTFMLVSWALKQRLEEQCLDCDFELLLYFALRRYFSFQTLFLEQQQQKLSSFFSLKSYASLGFYLLGFLIEALLLIGQKWLEFFNSVMDLFILHSNELQRPIYHWFKSFLNSYITQSAVETMKWLDKRFLLGLFEVLQTSNKDLQFKISSLLLNTYYQSENCFYWKSNLDKEFFRALYQNVKIDHFYTWTEPWLVKPQSDNSYDVDELASRYFGYALNAQSKHLHGDSKPISLEEGTSHALSKLSRFYFSSEESSEIFCSPNLWPSFLVKVFDFLLFYFNYCLKEHLEELESFIGIFKSIGSRIQNHLKKTDAHAHFSEGNTTTKNSFCAPSLDQYSGWILLGSVFFKDKTSSSDDYLPYNKALFGKYKGLAEFFCDKDGLSYLQCQARLVECSQSWALLFFANALKDLIMSESKEIFKVCLAKSAESTPISSTSIGETVDISLMDKLYVFIALMPLVEKVQKLSRSLLPYLVNDFICLPLYNHKNLKDSFEIGKCPSSSFLNYFFQFIDGSLRAVIQNNTSDNPNTISDSGKEIILIILNCLVYSFDSWYKHNTTSFRVKKRKIVEFYKFFQIDYFLLARACFLVYNCLHALYFLEIYFEIKNKPRKSEFSRSFTTKNGKLESEELCPFESRELELFSDIFLSLSEDKDAFNALPVTNSSLLLKRWVHENSYDKAFSIFLASSRGGRPLDDYDFLKCSHNLGMLASDPENFFCKKNACLAESKYLSLYYQAAWMNQKWEVFEDPSYPTQETLFDKLIKVQDFLTSPSTKFRTLAMPISSQDLGCSGNFDKELYKAFKYLSLNEKEKAWRQTFRLEAILSFCIYKRQKTSQSLNRVFSQSFGSFSKDSFQTQIQHVGLLHELRSFFEQTRLSEQTFTDSSKDLADKTTSDSLISFEKAWNSRKTLITKYKTYEESMEYLKLCSTFSFLMTQPKDQAKNKGFDLTASPKTLTLFKNIFTESMLEQIKISRKFNAIQTAMNSLNQLKLYLGSESNCKYLNLRLCYEEVKLLWKRGDHKLAISWLRSHLSPLTDNQSFNHQLYLAKGYSRLGQWLENIKAERPSKILQNYFQISHTLITELTSSDPLYETLDNVLILKSYGKIYYQLAKFSDSQYYVRSNFEDLETWYTLLEYKAQEIQDYEKKIISLEHTQVSKTQQQEKLLLERTLTGLKAQNSLDRNEYEKLIEEANLYLVKAIENYLLTLQIYYGPSPTLQTENKENHDLHSSPASAKESFVVIAEPLYILSSVFRLCSLWFEHCEYSNVNKLLESGLIKIPTYRLVPLIYQFVARLDFDPKQSHTHRTQSDTQSDGSHPSFQELIVRLVKSMSLEHPFHTLHQIFALKNSKPSGIEANSSGGGSEKKRMLFEGGGLAPIVKKKLPSNGFSGSSSNSDQRRAAVAEQIINYLVNKNIRLKKIVQAYETLCSSYIQLAIKESNSGGMGGGTIKPIPNEQVIKIDSNFSIGNIRDLKEIPVCTAHIAINPNGSYFEPGAFPYVVHFGAHYKLIGGINLPKVLECYGSDGQVYKQLVKNRDDLRQDAVMVQAFSLFHSILQHDVQSRGRALGLRTYKVIPLQPLCGVIEWVPNTFPIGDYLSSAHERIHSQDHTCAQARQIMKKEFDKVGTANNFQGKFEVYQNVICPKFHPVLRYFFWENFPQPQSWFTNRLSFIKSTAVGCMIGYIVGLGDRHCQNILLDKGNSEIIHIDLNLIFEQGKLLRIPEKIPFRLTRDLVDGMGSLGTEGTFREVCACILGLLRNKSELLVTILEAFKYDPLYKWSLSAAAACKAATEDAFFKKENVLKRVTLANQYSSKQLDPLALESGASQDHQQQPWVFSSKVNVSSEALNPGQSSHKKTNPEAERVLLKIKEKLGGIEEGSQLSIEGQVNYLIQMATDPKLLCQMYPGWQPWM